MTNFANMRFKCCIDCGLNYGTEITSDVITLGAGGDAVPPLAGAEVLERGSTESMNENDKGKEVSVLPEQLLSCGTTLVTKTPRASGYECSTAVYGQLAEKSEYFSFSPLFLTHTSSLQQEFHATQPWLPQSGPTPQGLKLKFQAPNTTHEARAATPQYHTFFSYSPTPRRHSCPILFTGPGAREFVKM